MKSYSFSEDVAKEYGVDAAILLRSFQFWIELNKARGNNQRDGRTWTFNTYSSIAEQFPFWDADKVRRIIDKLVKDEVLLKTFKYNRYNIDKTNWYAFNDESKWLSSKTVDELPKDYEEDSLFSKSEHEKDIDAEGENGRNLRLANKSDGKVNPDILSENSTDEKVNRLAEKSDGKVKTNFIDDFATGKNISPTDDKISGLANSSDPDLAKKSDSHLAKKSDQYQLLNSSLKINDREDKENNDRDILPTNFNDPDDLDKKVRRLFRLFVSEAVPHFQNVDNVKKELIDIRPMLTREVVWEIINEAFKKYPGLPKAQQSVNYLLGIIRGMKNDYVEQWNDARKKEELKEAAINRNTEMKREADLIQKENEKLSLKASQLLTEHKKLFSASEVNKLFAAIKQGRAQYALGTIEAMLEEKGVKVEG